MWIWKWIRKEERITYYYDYDPFFFFFFLVLFYFCFLTSPIFFFIELEMFFMRIHLWLVWLLAVSSFSQSRHIHFDFFTSVFMVFLCFFFCLLFGLGNTKVGGGVEDAEKTLWFFSRFIFIYFFFLSSFEFYYWRVSPSFV